MSTINQELSELRKEFFLEAEQFEHEFKKMHREQLRLAKRQGKSDKRKVFSDLTKGKFTPFEKTLYHQYEAHISELAIDHEHLLTRIKNEYVASIEERIKISAAPQTTAEMERLAKAKITELEQAETTYHLDIQELEKDTTLENMKDNHDEAEDAFEDLCDEIGRTQSNVIWNLNKSIYFGVIFFLGLIEVAASYGAFLHFEEQPIVTLIWGLGFGLGVSLFGHMNGLIFSKAREKRSFLSLGIGLLVFAIIVLILVSNFRASMANISVSEVMSTGVFVGISLLIYLVTVGMAYLTHDSNDNFEKLRKTKDATRIKLDAHKQHLETQKKLLRDGFEAKVQEIHSKYDKKHSYTQNAEANLQLLLKEAKSLHDEILAALRNLENMVSNYFHEVVAVYRTEAQFDSDNLLQLPPKFTTIPELTAEKNQGLWHFNSN